MPAQYFKIIHDGARVGFVALSLALTVVVVDAQTLSPVQQVQRPRRVMPPAPETYPGEELSEDDVVRVDTQLITVPVVVRDQHGQPMTGLKASDFQLTKTTSRKPWRPSPRRTHPSKSRCC